MSGKQDLFQTQPGLLQLPDEILIEILKLLSSYELMVMSKASTKLNLLRLRTKALWRDVDFSGHAFELQEMPHVLEYLHEETNSLTLEGLGYMDHYQPVNQKESGMCNIRGPLLTGITSHCENLKHLTFKKAWFPPFITSRVKTEHFPLSLTHLSLVGCKIYSGFFANSDVTLPVLEYLKIEDVRVFSESDFVDLKKNKTIQTLIMKRLRKYYCEFEFSYHEDLPNLKVLDMTDSGMTSGYCQLASFSNLGLRELTFTCNLEGQANYFVNGYAGNLQWIHSGLLKRNLEKLTLVKSVLDDEALNLIATECSNLKHVSLLKCQGITDAGVIIFENMLKEKNSSCEVAYEEAEVTGDEEDKVHEVEVEVESDDEED